MYRRIVLFILLMVITAIAVTAAPTAILVDTSRSIPASQFAQAKAMLQKSLPALTREGPVSLYAFNDKPELLVSNSTNAAALKASLEGLRQGGHYTLLYDGLFEAIKNLGKVKKPGLVLLVTDGKDENSAVTLEDAAGRAEKAHVAILAVGMGAVQEKVLRRLAVLSGGSYAGYLTKLNSAKLSGSVGDSISKLVPFPKAPAPKKITQAAAPQAPPKAPTPASRTWLWLLLLVLAIAVVLAVIGLLVMMKRNKPPEERVCEKCGRKLNMWETECPICLAEELSITKPGAASETPVAEPLPELDPELLKKNPPSEELENTIILDEIPVLVLKRGNLPQRLFQLPPDKAVSVGRDKVNTISVADKTLSGQHFRIVPKEEAFFIADLESTNGTFLNGERVTLKELKSGSVIRAGQCTFTFRRDQKRLN